MKYTESEVLDIIKSVTDKDPQDVFTTWVNRKANTLLDNTDYMYPHFVYTFPITSGGKDVGEITLTALSGHSQSLKDELMLKYFGKEDYDKSLWEFSHDTYLDCFLIIHKEFELPKICKGMCGDTFQGVDAIGRPFEFKVAYGGPVKERDSHYYDQWVDGGYRFDNGVTIQVNQMNGWSLGKKINENIEKRLIPYKREEKLNEILF
jgi:hypothetical protein